MTGQELGIFLGTVGGMILIITLMIWSLVWKGFALYKAARREDKIWFIVMLILNTLGLLEILYIFVFSNRPKAGQPLAEKEK